jgi:hypothetical protein
MPATFCQRFAEARIKAGQLLPYLKTNVLSLVPVPRPRLGTCAMDEFGRLYYDPAFMEARSVYDGAFVVLHEDIHFYGRHARRRVACIGANPSPEDLADWRKVVDGRVNEMLVQSGLKCPADGVLPARLGLPPNQTPEQDMVIMRQRRGDKRKQEEQQAQEQAEQEEDEGGEKGAGRAEQEAANQDSDSQESDSQEKQPGDDRQDAEQEDAADDAADAQDEGDGDDAQEGDADGDGEPGDGEDSEAGDAGGGDAGEEDSEGNGDGSDTSDTSDGDAGEENGAGDGGGADGADSPGDDLADEGEGQESDEPGDKEGEGDESDADGESEGDGEGEGQGQGEGQSDEAGDGDADGDGSSAEGGMGEGEGEGQPSPAEIGGSVADGIPRPWELGPPSDENPGLDESEQNLLEAQTAKAIEDHVASRGSVAAGLAKQASELLHKPVDPTRALAAKVKYAVDCTAGFGDYSYGRFNNRVSGGCILPNNVKPIPRVTVIVDTSGSMGGDDLALGLEIIGNALRNLPDPRGLRVLVGGTKVERAVNVFRKESVELLEGGGTNMDVLIRQAAEERPEPKVIIVVTDTYTPWPDKPVKPKVLVCATRKPWSPPPAWMDVVYLRPEDN